MDMFRLEINNYPINQELTFNFKYAFERHKVYIITGPSGVGKTTIFNFIRQWWTDPSVTLSPDYSYMQNVAQVYQDFKLIPYYSSYQNCQFVFEINDQPLSKKTVKNMANDLKFDFDLNKAVSQLSGGQQQKVAIMRTLLLDKEIYLFDEMTSNLDQDYTEFIIDYIIKHYRDKFLIFISHDDYVKNQGQVIQIP